MVIHHPDGTQYLLPTNSLVNTLMSTESAMRQDAADKEALRMSTIEAKRESLATGDAVPSEKRVV
jgi:hypothetical protein